MPAIALVAGALTAACVIPYIRDIRAGTTVPQRSTWFIFAALSALSAAGHVAERAWGGFGLSMGATVGFSIVAGLSIRHGRGGTGITDLVAMIIAGAGAAVWLTTGQAGVAVAGVIAAEWAAGALTISKAAREPRSETPATWAMDATAGLVALAAQPPTDLVLIAYPAHHFLLNAAVLAAIIAGHRTSRAAALT